jgi:hypothetical protein
MALYLLSQNLWIVYLLLAAVGAVVIGALLHKP